MMPVPMPILTGITDDIGYPMEVAVDVPGGSTLSTETVDVLRIEVWDGAVAVPAL